MWFWRYFWIFLYVLELNSHLTWQIFTKLQKIITQIHIYIVLCKLDLMATLNGTKEWLFRYFWIFLYVSDLNSLLTRQIFTELQKIVTLIHIYILPCKLYLCAMLNRIKEWFCRYVPELDSFLAWQIFTKLQKSLT